MANEVHSTNPGCLLVTCGDVSNAPLAVDTDLATAASLTAPLALTSATLRVRFPQTVPVGQRIRVVLSSSTGLDASTLGNVRVRTYLGNGNQAEQEVGVLTLLTVSSMDSNPVAVEFRVTRQANQLELLVGGLLTASYTVRLHGALATVSAPLPVELSSFAGQQAGESVQLRWQTASERMASHFVLERSAREGTLFEPIGQVQAHGTSSTPQSYQFRDVAPAGTRSQALYYRLRQVDSDGSIAYSPVLAVRWLGSEPVALHPYPNPTTDHVRLRLPAPTASVELLNALGHVVRSVAVGAGQAEFSFSLVGVPPGVYVLRAGTLQQRLVVY